MSATYRYFAEPHAFAHYSPMPRRCNVCGRVALGYHGPFAGAGTGHIEFVCDDCLASGRLAELGASLNEGDAEALEEQLRDLHPELSEDEIARLVHERSAELEQRTPAMVTWQGFFWPAHHGDYCRYIKEVGQRDLVTLAPDGDGFAYFRACCRNLYGAEHAREVWESMRPDAPRDSRTAYSTGFYLFQCLTCGTHIIMWDAD